MSHFYGTLKGQAGQATRRGSKGSGVETVAASWDGALHVFAYQHSSGADYVRVSLTTWHGQGSNVTLYDGPISGKDWQAYVANPNARAR